MSSYVYGSILSSEVKQVSSPGAVGLSFETLSEWCDSNAIIKYELTCHIHSHTYFRGIAYIFMLLCNVVV